jgi:hypothetical protein
VSSSKTALCLKAKKRTDAVRLKKLITEALKANGKRDKLVHSEWMALSWAQFKRFKDFKVYDTHITEIWNLIDSFKQLNNRLVRFMYDWEVDHPSPTFLKYLDLLSQIGQRHEKDTSEIQEEN